MKTVLITGASGFIARHAARALAPAGERVIGVSRSGHAIDKFTGVYTAHLTNSISDILAKNPVDAVVHSANHAGQDEYRVNVEGTTRWMNEAEAAGVKLQILLSSLSADANAPSEYGRAKYELERRFVEKNQVVLRLGLVVGDGGMFSKIRQSIEHSPIVPLLDGGRSSVYVLGVDYLANVICDCVRTGSDKLRGRVLQIQQPDPHTLRDVMMSIRRHYGYSTRFVPLPSLPILWAALVAERLPFVKLPVSSTHLRGMRQSRSQRYTSDFAELGYRQESLDDLVRRAQQLDHPQTEKDTGQPTP